MCARARDEKPCEHTHTLDGEKTLHHTHMLSVVRQTQAVMCAGATDRIDTATSERAHETIEMCTTSHKRAPKRCSAHSVCMCIHLRAATDGNDGGKRKSSAAQGHVRCSSRLECKWGGGGSHARILRGVLWKFLFRLSERSGASAEREDTSDA